MNHRPHITDAARPTPSRCGYTLIELLIASLLLTSLMAATWNLMSMYSGFLVAGRTQAVEQQLARSLMDLLADDLRSVVPQRETASSSFGEVDSLAPFSATSQRPETTQQTPTADESIGDPDEPYSPPPLPQVESFASTGMAEAAAELPTEFFDGEEQSLTLIVTQSRPDWESALNHQNAEGLPTAAVDDAAAMESADLSLGDALPSRPIAAEWIQIIYRFEPPRAVLQEDTGLSPGLHRFEIPVEYLGLLNQTDSPGGDEFFGSGTGLGEDASADLMMMIDLLRERGVTAITHEHIPEVVACRFEFLGESGWRSWWEDAFLDTRPQAIRIKIKLLPASEQQELMALLGAETEPAPGEEIVPDAPTDAASAGTDPYARFDPQLYERTILLNPQRADQPSEESVIPGSDSMSKGLLGEAPVNDRPLRSAADVLAGGRP